MAAPLIEVESLTTTFRLRRGSATAVDGLSLSISPGECVGLVGESGCGKSTTGLSIMRLLPPNGELQGGRILLDGDDLAELSEAEMRRVRGNEVALIPQDPMTSMNPTMTVGDQIAESVRIHRGASREEARRRALEVLRMVEMPRPEERLDQYPHELSGGLRQRAIIAMGLSCEPRLLIADEPTTALDVTIQAQILDLLDDLRAQLDMAVLLITHDMGVIAGRCDRVVVMYAGQMVEEAATDELFSATRHPYTAALLASVPSIEPSSTGRLASIPGLPPDLAGPLVGCRFAERCPAAESRCREEEPPLVEQGGHRFACFHPVDGAERPAAQPDEQRDAPEERPVLLSIRGLRKEFPVRRGLLRRSKETVKAVTDVSFDVHEGEVFGLVGESGCGKTTVARLISMLEPADAGTIAFEGADLRDLGGAALRRQRRDIQMMFQDPYASLDPRMRVGTILREPLAIHGIGSREEQKQRVEQLLAEVGLPAGSAERFPHEFSGGQRQRIGLARALALEPRLILADEPVSALDVSIQAQLLNLMKDQQAQRGLSMILVSHDLAVMRYMADRIAVMYLGRVVEIGPTDRLLAEPVHHYTRGLLDAVPVPDPAEARRRTGRQIRGELPSPIDPPSGCRFRTRCPAADERCAAEVPEMSEHPGGVLAACHHPIVAAPAGQPA